MILAISKLRNLEKPFGKCDHEQKRKHLNRIRLSLSDYITTRVLNVYIYRSDLIHEDLRVSVSYTFNIQISKPHTCIIIMHRFGS